MQISTSEEKNLITDVCENIRQIYPESKYVEVKITKDKNNFESLIKVAAPKRRIVAKKSAKNYKTSVDKSYEAVVRQIKKIKSKRNSKKHSTQRKTYLNSENTYHLIAS